MKLHFTCVLTSKLFGLNLVPRVPFFRYVKPCVPIISHRRPPESIEELGENVLAQWRPDSSMICVVVGIL